MKPRRRRMILDVGAAAAILALTASWAGAESPEAIGAFTAVQGKVSVIRVGGGVLVPASVGLHQDLFVKDIIETQRASRAKALFLDDSLLTAGENSRIAIAEYLYAPYQGLRRVEVHLMKGTVRALIRRTFSGQGSKYEIHTPTAVVTARGTSFAVWVEEKNPVQVGATGVANIGTHGRVTFASGGTAITLDPGHFSLALPGKPPVMPSPIAASAPPEINETIKSIEVKDAPKAEAPQEALLATRGISRTRPPAALSANVQGVQQPCATASGTFACNSVTKRPENGEDQEQSASATDSPGPSPLSGPSPISTAGPLVPVSPVTTVSPVATTTVFPAAAVSPTTTTSPLATVTAPVTTTTSTVSALTTTSPFTTVTSPVTTTTTTATAAPVTTVTSPILTVTPVPIAEPLTSTAVTQPVLK